MYPNPANQNIFLEIVLSGKNKQFSIYNTEGRLIKSEQKSVTSGRNLLEFNVADLPKGVYFLLYESNTKKIVFIKN